jgi:hypothetical protein
MDSASDEDLNSGGPLLILAAVSGLSLDIIVQAGKDGIIYIMNAETMGNPVLTDFAPNVFLKNVIGGLLSPPVWFTYYNPANPAPTDFSQMPTTYNGYTHHQHSTPVFFLSSIHGPMLFTWGENGNLRAWRINSNFTLTYLACSAEMASPNSGPPGGMPGGMLSLSANGSVAGSAILWACVPYGNANQSITQGRFLAYDAENFGTYANGSKQLVPLWDSRTWGINYTHNKFNIPHVWNGKIYVPTYSDQVMVFG